MTRHQGWKVGSTVCHDARVGHTVEGVDGVGVLDLPVPGLSDVSHTDGVLLSAQHGLLGNEAHVEWVGWAFWHWLNIHLRYIMLIKTLLRDNSALHSFVFLQITALSITYIPRTRQLDLCQHGSA